MCVFVLVAKNSHTFTFGPNEFFKWVSLIEIPVSKDCWTDVFRKSDSTYNFIYLKALHATKNPFIMRLSGRLYNRGSIYNKGEITKVNKKSSYQNYILQSLMLTEVPWFYYVLQDDTLFHLNPKYKILKRILNNFH